MHSQSRQLLSEGLDYKDMVGLLKPTIHLDEFSAKMGEDDEIVVVSFFIRDAQAAKDLVNWFESGYDFVLDASKSPGEIKPNRYLVYVEIRRRSDTGEQIEILLEDLASLTEFEPKDWTMHYQNRTVPWSVEKFNQDVPLSPRQYRERFPGDESLNEWRIASGLEPVRIHKVKKDVKELQSIAGII